MVTQRPRQRLPLIIPGRDRSAAQCPIWCAPAPMSPPRPTAVFAAAPCNSRRRRAKGGSSSSTHTGCCPRARRDPDRPPTPRGARCRTRRARPASRSPTGAPRRRPTAGRQQHGEPAPAPRAAQPVRQHVDGPHHQPVMMLPSPAHADPLPRSSQPRMCHIILATTRTRATTHEVHPYRRPASSARPPDRWPRADARCTPALQRCRDRPPRRRPVVLHHPGRRQPMFSITPCS